MYQSSFFSQTLSKSTDAKARERALRNHMAAHIIASRDKELAKTLGKTWCGPPIPDDPCIYCCSSLENSQCQVDIYVDQNDTKWVRPQCQTHTVPTFHLSLCRRAVKKLSTTNQPYECPQCVNVFVPLYNLHDHMVNKHHFDDDDFEHGDYKEALAPCFISEEEKTQVLNENKSAYPDQREAPVVLPPRSEQCELSRRAHRLLCR